MAYSINYSGQFRNSLKRSRKRGLDIKLLQEVIELLVKDGKLPSSYRPHILHGKLEGVWECHIKGDWLLLWKQNDKELTLLLLDTGTHSDLYDHK